MGERKVIQKYYPPDFDHTLLPKAKKPKNGQVTVRMMVPMTIRCLTCGNYIYHGTKFNSRKETVVGENYLGIKIFRFYIKCTRCSSEITFKTDPEHSDYVCELGATRNYDGKREDSNRLEQFRKEREAEEEGNAMKALENKTIDSKLEMDIQDGLEEIRSLNARHVKVNADFVLKQLQSEPQPSTLTEEDEQMLEAVDFHHDNEQKEKIDHENNSVSFWDNLKKVSKDDEPPAQMVDGFKVPAIPSKAEKSASTNKVGAIAAATINKTPGGAGIKLKRRKKKNRKRKVIENAQPSSGGLVAY